MEPWREAARRGTTGGDASMITWEELETAAPPIAQLAKERFEGTRIALLGTIRTDGSPRISPIEPYLSRGNLLLGAMSRSLKTRDRLRDPRCVLHTAVTAPDAGDPEVKPTAVRSRRRRRFEKVARLRGGRHDPKWPSSSSWSPSLRPRSSGTCTRARCLCGAGRPTTASPRRPAGTPKPSNTLVWASALE